MMNIKHIHIREALYAWAKDAGGEKIPTAMIVDAWRALGLQGVDLHDDTHPEGLNRNTQKIFRWAKSDSLASQRKLQVLLPAIEKAMPNFMVARMRSYSSETYMELIKRKQRIDNEMDALFGVMIAMSERVGGSGPAGNVLIH